MAGLILYDAPFKMVPSEVRLLTCRTPAGFPSPAQDDMEEPIDLGSWLGAGEKLRSHGLVAGQLTVFFHTNKDKRDKPQYAASRRVSLQPMTADSLELLAAARQGVEAAWRDGYEFSKAGIMLDDLITAELRPRTLFEGDTGRRERLMTALDDVNGRFGKFAAVPAAQGFRRDWKMRSENKSPAWTTRLAEVPVVRAG